MEASIGGGFSLSENDTEKTHSAMLPRRGMLYNIPNEAAAGRELMRKIDKM